MFGRYRKFTYGVCFIVGSGFSAYFVLRAVVYRSTSETLKTAEFALQERDIDSARDAVRWLLWFNPSNVDALLIDGLGLHVQRKFEESVRVLRKIPIDSPKFKSAGLVLTRSLILDYQVEQAEAVLKTYLTRYPEIDSAREELAKLYTKQLRRHDATELLRDRLRLFPDELSVLPGLLRIQMASDAAVEKIEYLSKVNGLRPGQGSIVLALAHACMLAGKTEAAAAAFEEAVQLRPQHMETNVLAAQFHISQGDTATAKVLLTSNWAVAVNREDGIQFDDQYWYVMARCHMLSGAKGKAIEAIESALELRPSKIIYHSFQSDVLRHLGKGAEAARVSETVGRLSIARRRLFLIDQELKLDRPDPKQCSDIAELMDQLNNPLEARQWRQVALIDQGGTR